MTLAEMISAENAKRSIGTNQRNELLKVITEKGIEADVLTKIAEWEKAKKHYEAYYNAAVDADPNNAFWAADNYRKEFGKDAYRFANMSFEKVLESFVDRYVVVAKVDPADIDYMGDEVTVYDGYDLAAAMNKFNAEDSARIIKNNGEKVDPADSEA